MFLAVDFGTLHAGLSTVGYTQKKADGTDAVARTTTGVVALGNGAYGVSVTLNAATVAVKWDTGGSSPVYAHEVIEADRLIVDYVDAATSSRLAGAGYTAPDNAGVAAIKAKTDQLAFTSGAVQADVKRMNGAVVVGDGTSGDKWRGA